MPRNHWAHKIDVSDVFHNDDMDLPAKGKAIAAKIKAAPFYPGAEGGDLEQIIEELEDAAEADDERWFNLVWDAFYDYADAERIWVNTLEGMR